MADAPETIITVKADTKPAEQSASNLFDKFAVGITGLNSAFELTEKAVKLVGEAVRKALDFAKAGEEIKAIGIRFEALATQAGLIPENIAEGISQAVAGTVDMEEALQAATQALVTLETGTDKIPQLFEVAKKASLLFGGEVTDRFEQITQAVASGSTRMLKSIGLVIDSESVFKKYAATLNVTASELTQAERQQAILNAVLEKGKTQFQNIDGSITPITTSLKKQAVAVGELGDTFKTLFNNVFGTILTKSINNATSAIDVLNIKLGEFLLGKTPSISEQIRLLNYELDELAKKRDLAAVRGDIGRIEQIQNEINAVKQQIIEQQTLMFQEQTAIADRARATNVTNAKTDAVNRLTIAQKEAAKALADKAAAEKKESDDAAAYLKRQGEMVKQTFQGVFVNGIQNAFSAFGRALVTGGDAFGEFGRQALSMLGSLAMQMGQFLILAGAGWMLIPGFQASAGAVAAGIALTVLGGVLQALGAGGGTPAAPGTPAAASPAGGGTTASYDSPMAAMTPEQERAKAQTGVQVIVQGNIFDNRETGLQIAQIINDSFDLEGTQIRAFA